MTIGVLHTTESDPGTLQGVASYLERIGAEPHVLFDPSTGEVVQFLPTNTYAKALRNLPGGVETNRHPAGVFQVEIVARSADVGSYSDEWYSRLQAYLVQWSTLLGIRYTFYEGPRLSFDEWTAAAPQWYGHCHVPENDHWDPGTLDLARLRIPLQNQDPDMQLTDRTTNDHTVNDVLEWTLQRANEASAKLDALLSRTAPAPANIRSFTTAELLAELVRRQSA